MYARNVCRILLVGVFAFTHNVSLATTTLVDKLDNSRASCKRFKEYATNKMHTYGLRILKDGQPIFEQYQNKATPKNLFRVFSISKTVSALMLGAAIEQTPGVSLDSYVSDFIPMAPLQGDQGDRRAMRLRDLITMGSGIDWNEYEGWDPTRLMYSTDRKDTLKFISQRKLVSEPGERYNYTAANYHLLAAVFKKLYPKTYNSLPGSLLFDQLGVKNYAFEQDGQGIFMGGTGLSIDLETFSKLGQLFINNGRYQGKQVIPARFIEFMRTPTPNLSSSQTPDQIKAWEGTTGASAWLNRKLPAPIGQWFPRLPEDLVYLGGKFGQFLLVFPSQNIVIARIGADANHSQHWQKFAYSAFACANEATAESALLADLPASTKTETTLEQYAEQLEKFVNNFTENFFINYRAQEVCSCLFVGKFKTASECERQFPLPEAVQVPQLSGLFNVRYEIDYKRKRVTAHHEVFGAGKFKLPGGTVIDPASWIKAGIMSAQAEIRSGQEQLGCQLSKPATRFSTSE